MNLERHVLNVICEGRLCPEQSHVRTWGSEWAGGPGEFLCQVLGEKTAMISDTSRVVMNQGKEVVLHL